MKSPLPSSVNVARRSMISSLGAPYLSENLIVEGENDNLSRREVLIKTIEEVEKVLSIDLDAVAAECLLQDNSKKNQ